MPRTPPLPAADTYTPLHGPWAERSRAMARRLGQLIRLRSCPPQGLPRSGIHRILVVRPNHRLGNTLLVTPLLSELEARYPGAEVDIVAAGGAAGTVFGSFATVRRIYLLPSRALRHPLQTLRQLREIGATRYDLVIDAGIGSNSGRLLSAITQARYRLSYGRGHADAAWRDYRPAAHMAARPVHLLRTALGVATDEAVPPMDLRLNELERERGRQRLHGVLGGHGNGPVLAIFANATGAKHLGTAWWLRFIEVLLHHLPGTRIVEVLPDHAQSQLGEGYPCFYSRDLRKLASTIAAADAFISADCGVMHLGAASGVTTVGLFSVTPGNKYGPRDHGSFHLDGVQQSADATANEVARRLSRLPAFAHRLAANAAQ